MDTSDDEKWEDFFGSSTDLTPSVIGYYDRLSGSFQADKIIGEITASTVDDTAGREHSPKPKLIVSKIPTKAATSSSSSSSNKSSPQLPKSNLNSGLSFTPSPVVVAAKTLQIISPNVHRMISSHQTTTETVTALPFKTSSHSLVVSNKRLHDKSSPVHLPTRRNFLKSNKPTGIAIPLTKNLSKISQSNGIGVDALGSEPIVHTITDNSCHREDEKASFGASEASEKTPTNCDHNFNYDEDEDDNIQRVLNKTSELINNLLLNSSHNDSNLKSLDIHESRNDGDAVKSADNEDISAMKKSNNAKYQQLHSDNSDDDEGGGAVKKFAEKFSKSSPSKCDMPNFKFNSLDNVAAEMDAKQSKTPPTASPKLTYSRAKLQPTQQPLSSPSNSAAATATTTTTPMSDGKLNASPSTKHRPLSAASISSSSSSTSSASSSNSFGNEHLPGGKFAGGMTYLASIESLADHSENEANPSLTMCERAVLEIIDSEKCYVEDLGQIIKGYLQNWKERECLQVDELDVLFSNIQEIYEFNSSLLEKLIESEHDPQKISKCFIQEHERFDVYTTYCTSYPDAISLLTSLLQASRTNALLISTQKMLQHDLPLGSYLLKPVQRILKYHLLLDSLKKHCDIPEVKEAHEMMKNVARNIDQVKKKLEQKNRVKELAGILDGWLGPDLQVLGELRQEGLLMEHNKPRIVFLFEEMLIITKPKEDKRLQFKTYIPCKTLMLVEHLPGDPTSFHVLPFSDPRSQIKLTAKNRDQKRLWAQQIKQAMLEHFDIPSRAKELVFKLGDEEDRPCDKQTWKWSHSSSTPEYLERRHQYRRSEVRYRSKKAKKTAKTASLERGRIKERRESFISYSRDDLFNSDHLKKCDHRENCSCEVIKKEMSDTLKKKVRSKSESRNAEEGAEAEEAKIPEDQPVPLSPLEIKMYNAKTLPKRIEKIKKSREKKETAKFYASLDDDENQPPAEQNTVLKIVEATDAKDAKTKEKKKEKEDERKEAEGESSKTPKKKDSEIIKSILVQSELASRRLQSKSMSRRTSLEKIEQSSPLSSRKLAEALAAIKADTNIPQPTNSRPKESPPQEEPLYEELLRNVHVPYKFAPPMLKRSQSVSSASSSVKDKIQASTTTINDDDGSDCDYVTLTYSNDKLETIDGVFVSKNSSGSSDEVKMEKTLAQSENCLDRRDSMPVIAKQKSFLHKFMNSKSIDEDRREPMGSRKSLDGGLNLSWKSMIYKTSTTDISLNSVATPPIYRQGSEDLGSRIANVDYADPRTLFASSSNILINRSSLSQRDSVVSSSTDSIVDPQKHLQLQHQQQQQHQPFETFSDSFYEDNAESVLENDFRDSAIYSDDSNEKRSDSTLSPSDDHIYSTVNKTPPKSLIPPKIPKKPAMLLKSSFANRSAPAFTTLSSPQPATASHPPVPLKPSSLQSPEVRNAIINVRKLNQFAAESSSAVKKLPKHQN